MLVPLEERRLLDRGSHARVLMGYAIVVTIAAYVVVAAVVSSDLNSHVMSRVRAGGARDRARV